ncbi:glycerophosphodiester phosphodiesterase [Sulfurovum mangrovi]|uniref:glycerophosphodiester phosphodiesterase n=1 Tax=Sulfurovum mangrovi TaxID=2893889 RepID=UPI001E2A7F8F|nr:glycerophosphodiester phosphodiesterase family protein [Sulfurovum mangrovi]UFH58473.1 glycerophosphodiester phosphodiesterase [Sulfurovum mangrovi]
MNFLELFKKPNLIAAHRGDRSKKPENTLSALVSSVGKCDFAEIDVELTKDLVPVILHDETLARTSNISEIKTFEARAPWRVSDFTFQELQQLDFGSWFDGNYEPLLTLEKALTFAKEAPLFLNVEIKDMSETFADSVVIEKIIAPIKKTQSAQLILLSSFYHHYLPLCKRYAPSIPTAALEADKHQKELITYLHTLEVDAYHPAEKIATRELVENLREAGFFVNVYTVNAPSRQQELFSWGVNGIFTDNLGE